MTVDLILHGVPNGHDSWGEDIDKHYLSTFYVKKSDRKYLLIETRKIDGKPYVYYHYLKYNNVMAADGRSGSYLGITLKIDAYYKDILNIYNIMEVIYNRYLTDVAFTNEGDSIKYKVSKFDMIEAELKDAQSKIVNLILLSAKQKDFETFDSSYFNNDNKTIKVFLLDCTQENVMQAMKKFGRIEISKYYPSLNEQQKIKSVEARFEGTVQQKELELKRADSKINEFATKSQAQQNQIERQNNEIANLKSSVKEKENRLKELQTASQQIKDLEQKNKTLTKNISEREKTIIQLRNELNRQKENRDIKELIDEIKDPLLTLAKVAGRQSGKFPTFDFDNDNKNCVHDKGRNNVSDEKNGKNPPKKMNALTVIFLVAMLALLGSSYPIYKYFWGDKNKENATLSIIGNKQEADTIVTTQQNDTIINNKKNPEYEAQK